MQDATLKLGPLTVLIGANAAGKSNLRDAFLFLHGIGRGYTLAEILGEKYVGGERVWSGTRGGHSRRVAACSISPVRAGTSSPERRLCTMIGFADDARKTSNDWKAASVSGPRIEHE